jgi:uracil-DNA glycosylase
MTDPAESAPDKELLELTRHARAWVEYLRDSGLEEAQLSDPEVLRSAPRPAPHPASSERSAVSPAQTAQAQTAQAQTAQAQTAQAQTAQAQPHPARGPDQSPAASPPPIAAKTTTAPVPRPARDPSTPTDPAERKRRLAVLAEEVASCTKCSLHETRTNAAFARGNPEAELLFVGEGPGAEEDRQGLPFVGAAGQLLDKMIVAMGYARDDVYICNVVKCRPPKNRKPEPDEVTACKPYLEEQVALVNPKVMVALGATGVQGLLGTSTGITRMRGSWKVYRGRIPLMPTFHPAYLLRQAEKKRDVWNDLKQVMARLGKEPPQKKRGG